MGIQNYYKNFPWNRFIDFISPGADRFALLDELLKQSGLEYRVPAIKGNRHIIIGPPPLGPEAPPLTILVAHYDRSENSPGANDNSAGVFILLEAALKLSGGPQKDWQIIFTDKEELKTGDSVEAQGAYNLAAEMKGPWSRSRIFSFDACGTGDTLIISTTAEYLIKAGARGMGIKGRAAEKLLQSTAELRRYALERAKKTGLSKVLLAPTPFSDDAGFFRAGLAAQVLTMLPTAECRLYMGELRKNPNLAASLISAEKDQPYPEKAIPPTWRILNGPEDSLLRLSPQHFTAVRRLAEALCKP
ncbi:MAG: M28 family metallopeptidase [Treponema sp.]|nr:M28 family metallopeptidase [Treponema sp.]